MTDATRWGALLELSIRRSLGGRRGIGLGLLALAPTALVVTMEQVGTPSTTDLLPTLFVVGVGLVVPLASLIVGVGALRSELEEGTIVHLATRPVSREAVILTRIAGAGAVATLTGALALSLAVPLIGGPAVDAWGAGLVAVLLAGAAYTSLFALLGVLTQRAILLGLAFLVAWEGVVASTPLLFRTWTLAYWIRSFLVNEGGPAASAVADSLSASAASTGSAVLVLLGVAVATSLLGAAWFGRKELPGAEPDG